MKQPPSHADPSQRHILALDGLRGVAVLLVLFYHFTRDRPDTWPQAVLRGVFRNFGWCGVDLFFVLSGFLITGLLLDAKQAAGYFRNFYARRVLRIFPLYYAYLAVIWLVAPWAGNVGQKVRAVGNQAVWYWLYLQNYAIAAAGTDAGDWPHSQLLNHLWSLAIEEQFYIVWPLVVLVCSRRWLMALCGSVAIASPLVRMYLLGSLGTFPLYVLTPTRLDGLVLGGLIAAAARGPGGIAAWAGAARAGLALGAAGVALIFWHEQGFSYKQPQVAVWGYTALAVLFSGSLVLCVLAPAGSWLGRVFTSAGLRSMGRYSYALYVFHQGVAVSVDWLLARVAPPAWLEQWLVYALGFGISYLLALLSWYLYERHFLRLKRFFPRPSEAGGPRPATPE